VAHGVQAAEVLFIGGHRLEAEVYPAAGFPLLQVDIRGVRRRSVLGNAGLPIVMARATRRIAAEFRQRRVKAVLGMGSYVSVPAALAARLTKTEQGRRLPFLLHEQNAEAGLANRAMAPLATRVFGSFPETARLTRAEWIGNPIRRPLDYFNRSELQEKAKSRYGLSGVKLVVGLVGGSLGARLLNEAAPRIAAAAASMGAATLHLTGARHAAPVDVDGQPPAERALWKSVGFEEHMEFFYAACDLVVARAGGAVAELTATKTPAVLVPGGFGSGRHQQANADAMSEAGAAITVAEAEIERVPAIVARLLVDPDRLHSMVRGCLTLARPHAADHLAAALIEAAHG
jgi:UDP-N-acetylglucosamine--N-acetylmuramyl-(pentapeptide) pyrophosphoryl-undecaprenol N-acetylglucosamine transferase